MCCKWSLDLEIAFVHLFTLRALYGVQERHKKRASFAVQVGMHFAVLTYYEAVRPGLDHRIEALHAETSAKHVHFEQKAVACSCVQLHAVAWGERQDRKAKMTEEQSRSLTAPSWESAFVGHLPGHWLSSSGDSSLL